MLKKSCFMYTHTRGLFLMVWFYLLAAVQCSLHPGCFITAQCMPMLCTLTHHMPILHTTTLFLPVSCMHTRIQWFLVVFYNSWDSPLSLGVLGPKCSENNKKCFISVVLAEFFCPFQKMWFLRNMLWISFHQYLGRIHPYQNFND